MAHPWWKVSSPHGSAYLRAPSAITAMAMVRGDKSGGVLVATQVSDDEVEAFPADTYAACEHTGCDPFACYQTAAEPNKR